jgi:uncharacterized protein
MNKYNRYYNYTQLLSKVDAVFLAAQERHTGQFQCMAGCIGCCQAGLSVSNVEARRIGDWLLENPAVAAKIIDRTQMLDNPDYCSLLDSAGSCSIYDVRPLICRSHGMPVSMEEEPEVIAGDVNDHSKYLLTSQTADLRDVCPLNFEGVDLASISCEDVLSLEKLNVLLSLINIDFDQTNAGERVSLMTLCSLPEY